MAQQNQADSCFSNEVLPLRAEYEHRRLNTNLFPPNGRRHLDMELTPGEKPSMTYWIDEGTKSGQCVRIFDVPRTLSGDILRLYRDLPSL